MLSLDWLKARGWRALWSLMAVGLVCLSVLASDFGSAIGMEQFAGAKEAGGATVTHFAFRVFFLCAQLLALGGMFAPMLPVKKQKLGVRLRVVFTDADALIWLVLVFGVVFLLPEGLGFLPQMRGQTYGDSLWLRLALGVVGIVASALVMAFGGGMEPKENTHPMVMGVLIVGKSIGMALLFLAASVMLPAVCSAYGTIASIPSLLSLPVIVALVLVIVLFLMGGALLSCRKQKRFWKRLEKQCKESGFEIRNARCSFGDFFFAKRYCGAVLQRGATAISFRLCALRGRFTPAVFDKEGRGVRLRTLQFAGVKLFTLKPRFSFAVEGEGEKVAVLCPCPKSIFITKQNGSLTEADNGDRPYDGSCTLYTAESFLNHLDRLP